MLALRSIVFILLYGVTRNEDPCKAYTHLPEMERRLTSYRSDVDNGEIDICDKYLPAGGAWYFVDVDMPTTAPPMFSCGTTFSIWYNGTLPTDSRVVHGKACKVKGKSHPCDTEYLISIKKCVNFNVYFLRPTKTCAEAYCFGRGTLDTPPSEVLKTKPQVKYVLEPVSADGITRDVLQFECYFGKTSDLQSPYYQVTWVVNGESVMTKTASKSELTSLRLKDLTSSISTLDKTLMCVVRPKNNIDGRSGHTNKSESFYAGIKVSKTSFSLEADSNVELKFNLTVPFGCMRRSSLPNTNCEITVQMLTKPDAGHTNCTSKIISNAVNCRLQIKQLDWSKEHSIKLSFKGKGTYNVGYPNAFSVNLETSIVDDIWDEYKFPTITINVYNSNSASAKAKGKKCKSHNDPHMRTFDGRTYENQHEGVYTLYEHIDQHTPMQVQIKLDHCWPGSSVFCNCGVAVRAGGDVFIADICNGKKMMGYKTCHDKILDVRRFKTNEKLYTIFFPTETRIDITWSISFFNVDITASVHDYMQTRGLCGNLSDTCTDDFLLKDNTSSTTHITSHQCDKAVMFQHDSPSDFIASWSLTGKSAPENLFELQNDQHIGLWNTMDSLCECPKDFSEAGHFGCSPEKCVTCTRDDDFDPVGSRTCHETPGRRKRSIEFPFKSFNSRRYRRSASSDRKTSNVTMTSQQAMAYCRNTIGESGIYKACGKIDNIKSNTAIESCALDIELAKSLDWTESTMETFKTGCLGELQANETLQRNGSHGAPSIAESVRSILCPGLPECSTNGECVNGTCICNDTFIASDCSIDKRQPPEMFGVRGDGLCDTSEIDCDTAFVLGDHVGSSRELSCRVHKYHISKSGDKTSTGTWIANASLETFVEVHCPLRDQLPLRLKRSVEYEMFMEAYKLSISYDMENFGQELDLIIYDSKCQIADPDSNPPLFALKKSTCYIDGKCYFDGEQKPEDVCNICNPLSPYTWSIPLEIEGCVKIENEGFGWVAGPVVGSIVLVAVIICGYVLYQKRARAKIKTFKDIQSRNEQ